MFGKKLLLRYSTETEAHILGLKQYLWPSPHTFGIQTRTETSYVRLYSTHQLSQGPLPCHTTPWESLLALGN